jgi:tetratricopeptide (TPR) repeat protein
MTRAWVALLAGALAACGSSPPAPPTPAPAPAPAPAAVPDPWAAGVEAFEQRQRDTAAAAARQGQWFEAAWAWEVLQSLNPNDAEIARRLGEARANATSAAAERIVRARQAQSRGDTETATRLYLEALALVPGQADAADALRTIERERVRRQHLGQVSRYTMTRRMDFTTPPAAAAAPERNEVEHAVLLANQGELDGAIAVLKPLATSRDGREGGDAAARKLLADLYVKRADSLAASDRAAAIDALERALAADPTHPRAATRLKLLRDAAQAGTSAKPAAGNDDRKARPKTPTEPRQKP